MEGPLMKAYLLTTGTVFGLITVSHIWRAVMESRALVKDPGFIALTLLAAGMCIWAFSLLRPAPRANRQ